MNKERDLKFELGYLFIGSLLILFNLLKIEVILMFYFFIVNMFEELNLKVGVKEKNWIFYSCK